MTTSTQPPESFDHEQDVSFEEIAERLPLGLAQELDLYEIEQIKEDPGATNPWPDDFSHKESSAHQLMDRNTNVYSDDIEAYLEQDPAYRYLLGTKMHHPDSEQLARFIRARRTILVRLLLEDLRILTSQLSGDSTSETEL